MSHYPLERFFEDRMLLDPTWVCVPGVGNCPSARLPLFHAWREYLWESERKCSMRVSIPALQRAGWKMLAAWGREWTWAHRKLSWAHSLLAKLGSDWSLSVHYKIVWASRFIHWTHLFVFLHNLLSTVRF